MSTNCSGTACKKAKLDNNMSSSNLNGIIPATFTPMLPKGEVDYGKIRPYAEFLARRGIDTVFVCGTSGEFASLSVSERKKVVEEWIKVRNEGIIKSVIAHIGHCNVYESIELAKHADQLGVDAFAAVPPWYFPVIDLDGCLETIQLIAKSAPSRPFVFYHIPIMIQFRVSIAEFMRKAAATIPNLLGMKFSHYDLSAMFECSQIKKPNGDKLKVYLGMDDMSFPAKTLGITDSIGSTYNFMVDIFQRMEVAYGNKDMEAGVAETAIAQNVISRCLGSPYGMLPAFKAVMSLIGMDLGPARLPHRVMSDEDIEKLKVSLQEVGLLK